MFNFKTKVLASFIAFLVLVATGVTVFSNFEKTAGVSKNISLNSNQSSSAQSDSSCTSAAISCQPNSPKESIAAPDLNVVTSSSPAKTAQLATTNQTTVKGMLSNLEIQC
jgi:predicted lipid-binding transport protein (Tim44 family)